MHLEGAQTGVPAVPGLAAQPDLPQASLHCKALPLFAAAYAQLPWDTALMWLLSATPAKTKTKHTFNWRLLAVSATAPVLDSNGQSTFLGDELAHCRVRVHACKWRKKVLLQSGLAACPDPAG